MTQPTNVYIAAGRRTALGIVRFLTGSRSNQADHVLHRAPDYKARREFSSLPVEILLRIRDFLPLSSAACLLVCSRYMVMALGNQCLNSLRAEDQIIERRRFLILLQKDLPDWQLCNRCSLFHPVRASEGPQAGWRYGSEPPCVEENGYIYLTLDFNIRYENVQLLMDRYRFGRSYTKELEALSFNFSRIHHDSTLEGKIWGEIVAGQFLLRVSQRLCLLGPHSIRDIQNVLRPICPHSE